MPAPSVAVKAVNQYRKRDIFAYLGLRYYLANSSANSSRWIREVCTDLVLDRFRPGYLKSKHFKEISRAGSIEHRDIWVPGPVEALVESQLISSCHELGAAFLPAGCVYSYLAPEHWERSGIFRNYMNGLQGRHRAIAEACHQEPGAVVFYSDIRRFYPSISVEVAHTAWEKACRESDAPSWIIAVGSELLARHGSESGGYLLTGPMFSHMIGNLVLREVDQQLSKVPCRYFRYVDDVTFAGSPDNVSRALDQFREAASRIGLTLHDADSSKSMEVQSNDWLASEHDFAPSNDKISWLTVVRDTKDLLLWHPESVGHLKELLVANDVRLPLPEYQTAIQEYGFLARTKLFIRRKRWFARRITPESIIRQALHLRTKFDEELTQILPALEGASPFESKRLIPKARYRLGRLAYLAPTHRLMELANSTTHSSLSFHTAVNRAIAGRDLTELLLYGSNAVQAAAQVLRITQEHVVLDREVRSVAEFQALAVAYLNGLNLHYKASDGPQRDPLLLFALEGANLDMLTSRIPFVSEVACLHGLSEVPRHQSVLDTAFDVDEDLAMDVVEQARSSLSG